MLLLAAQPQPLPLHTLQVSVSGVGRHLGISVQWRMLWRRDGAFMEEISGKELAFKWGYDGQHSSTCWEVREARGATRLCACERVLACTRARAA